MASRMSVIENSGVGKLPVSHLDVLNGPAAHKLDLSSRNLKTYQLSPRPHTAAPVGELAEPLLVRQQQLLAHHPDVLSAAGRFDSPKHFYLWLKDKTPQSAVADLSRAWEHVWKLDTRNFTTIIDQLLKQAKTLAKETKQAEKSVRSTRNTQRRQEEEITWAKYEERNSAESHYRMAPAQAPLPDDISNSPNYLHYPEKKPVVEELMYHNPRIVRPTYQSESPKLVFDLFGCQGFTDQPVTIQLLYRYAPTDTQPQGQVIMTQQTFSSSMWREDGSLIIESHLSHPDRDYTLDVNVINLINSATQGFSLSSDRIATPTR